MVAPLVAPGLYFAGLILFDLTDTSRDIGLMLVFNLVVLFAVPVSYGRLILGVIVFFGALISEGIIDIGSLLTYGEVYEQLFPVCIGATPVGSVAFRFSKIRS